MDDIRGYSWDSEKFFLFFVILYRPNGDTDRLPRIEHGIEFLIPN